MLFCPFFLLPTTLSGCVYGRFIEIGTDLNGSWYNSSMKKIIDEIYFDLFLGLSGRGRGRKMKKRFKKKRVGLNAFGSPRQNRQARERQRERIF